MKATVRTFITLCFCFLLIGCSEEQSTTSGFAAYAPTTAEVGGDAQLGMFREESSMPTQVAPSSRVVDRSKLQNRRIAETHSLQIETMHEDLSKRYDRDFQKCIELGCEILHTNMQNRRYGNINARIEPEKLGEYLDFLATGNGELKSHSVQTQDKTLNYIDTEARIKNNEALKTRLVTLLNKADTIDNVIKIETELARVEQSLDSAKGALRHLSTITSKATVNVNYQVPYPDIQVRYHDLKHSFIKGWQQFIENISNVIIFIGAIIPWIPIFFVGIWFLIATFRFAFKKKNLLFLKFKKDTQNGSDVDKCE